MKTNRLFVLYFTGRCPHTTYEGLEKEPALSQWPEQVHSSIPDPEALCVWDCLFHNRTLQIMVTNG